MATPFGSGSQVGSPEVQPSGSSLAVTRSSSALRSGFAAAQESKSCCHAAFAVSPRSTACRVCLITTSSTSKLASGSKPRIFLTAATSSAPNAAPCALPVFIRCGAGQAITVRRTTSDGRSVTAPAASSASFSAATSSV